MGNKSKAAAAEAKPEQTGKAAAADPKQPDAKAGKGKRAKDEIDDIFSSKPAAKKAATGTADGEGAAEGPAAGAAAGGSSGGGGGGSKEEAAALQELAAKVKEARDKHKGERPKVEGSKDDIFGESSGKARKRTEEGFAIYSEAELGLGKKGGETDKCPFDCDCCF